MVEMRNAGVLARHLRAASVSGEEGNLRSAHNIPE